MRRGRRPVPLRACTTGLLLAAAVAQAQPSPDRAIDEYRNAARRALHACSKPFTDAGAAPRAPDASSAQCVASAKNAVADKFDAAVASTMDPAVRAALQRHQAAFFASLTGVAPLPGEAATGYRQRQMGLRCALSHAWTDVEQSEAGSRFKAPKVAKP